MPAPDPLVVFGCGGHGKVVADAALAEGWKVLGFLDDNPERHGEVGFAGLPVLGGLGWLENNPAVRVALGVGDNAFRQELAARLEAERRHIATIVHPAAVVTPSAHLCQGAVVFAGAVVNPDAEIGPGAIVNTSAVVEHDVRVGAYAHVSPNAALGGGASLGDRAHLGLGANVLPLHIVGADTVVGAGAVVVKDLPSLVVAYGVPAREQRGRKSGLRPGS